MMMVSNNYLRKSAISKIRFMTIFNSGSEAYIYTAAELNFGTMSLSFCKIAL